MRLSLAPSAAADALCGLTLAAGGSLPTSPGTGRIVAASLCAYHGGLVLNDWADREHDRRTRPERPLPAGAIAAGSTLCAAVLLLGAAVGLAWSAAPTAGAWMAGVCLLVVAYDLWGRGPWSGPSLLALCRAGNLGLGFAFVADPVLLPVGVALASTYGAYVFLASRLGRMEDGEDAQELGQRPRTLLLPCAALLLLLPAWPAVLPAWHAPAPAAWAGAVLLATWAALGVVRPALATRHWTRALVERSMGGLLRRLLVITATASLLAPAAAEAFNPRAGWVVGLAILAGYPLSFALRRVFPPS